ncbi:hypothetical protein HYC85_009115 [Camellia sinensis]|uniref:Uncharacterized protein n=1 Tax=Camellia sinensis TaxID=4442 RepID=A0A7J7HG19_CAMSI|nr:hypothetical protein HYC85_009115 [Camellia sinensis]
MKTEVVGRRRSYTRRSKSPSSWTSQPPPIPTLPRIVTGSVCVSDEMHEVSDKMNECDQKHEEEMDPEVISKNFVLQVMVARSPNIRLHKALNKKASRNKNCLPSPNSFRSVQNPKPTSIAERMNTMVAKALVFQSPKKVISVKTSSELRTPLTKIGEGMKRLEISSQRKRILGYSNKSSKDIKHNPDKSLPFNPSGRKLSAYNKDKSKAKELFRPPNCEEKGNRSLRCIEKGNKHCNSMPTETVENDSSGMAIDMKSRDSLVFGSSRITKGNVFEEWLLTEETSGNLDTTNST